MFGEWSVTSLDLLADRVSSRREGLFAKKKIQKIQKKFEKNSKKVQKKFKKKFKKVQKKSSKKHFKKYIFFLTEI